MDAFTTDKVGHGYLPTYLDIAAQLPNPAHILEVGVAGGDSLRMWRHLAPGALVVGVDINAQAVWPDGTHRVVAAQDDPTLPLQLPADEYDLIVDDASHDNDKTRATWCLLWDLVRPGGWYVIEDWTHCGGLIREFAKELTDCFDEVAPLDSLVESITYRSGLIVLTKVSQ